MSPNSKIVKNLLIRTAVLLTGLVNRVRVGRVKPVAKHAAKRVVGPRHALHSHAESKWVWTVLEAAYGAERSQEIRQDAASRRGERRRVNGFVTVDMLIRRAEA